MKAGSDDGPGCAGNQQGYCGRCSGMSRDDSDPGTAVLRPDIWRPELSQLPSLRAAFESHNVDGGKPASSHQRRSSRATSSETRQSKTPSARPPVQPFADSVSPVPCCSRAAPPPEPDNSSCGSSRRDAPPQPNTSRRVTYDVPPTPNNTRRDSCDATPQQNACRRRDTYDVPPQQNASRRRDTYVVPPPPPQQNVSSRRDAYDVCPRGNQSAADEPQQRDGGAGGRNGTFSFTGTVVINYQLTEQQEQPAPRDRPPGNRTIDEIDFDLGAPRALAVPGQPYVNIDLQDAADMSTPEHLAGGNRRSSAVLGSHRSFAGGHRGC